VQRIEGWEASPTVGKSSGERLPKPYAKKGLGGEISSVSSKKPDSTKLIIRESREKKKTGRRKPGADEKETQS